MKTSTKLFTRRDRHLVYEARFSAEKAAPKGYFSDDEEAFNCANSSDMIDTPDFGKRYKVASREYVGGDREHHGKVYLIFSLDCDEGWAGNSDPTVKRFHGWRGTTNDWALHGEGVRVCTHVSVTGKRSKRVRIVFGPDETDEE